MKIKTRTIPVAGDVPHRAVTLADVPALAILMDRAYTGTIDHEGETLEQCQDEMQGTLTGRYGPFLDFASFAVFEAGHALSASLVTLYKEKPLLAFSMTAPEAQGKGYAGFLIERSITALAEHGHREFHLVVTDGNTPAERLYRKLGFITLGSALPGQAAPQN